MGCQLTGMYSFNCLYGIWYRTCQADQSEPVNKLGLKVFLLLKIALHMKITTLINITQGIDGSARKPALRKDTGYMVEKTYTDITPYLGAFGA